MKVVKDVLISRRFGLPIQTIQKWKNADASDWRYKIYNLVKEFLYGEEHMISDREIQINQRIVALKKIFGDYMEDYKLEIVDIVIDDIVRDTSYIRAQTFHGLKARIYNNIIRVEKEEDIKLITRVLNRCTNHNDIIQLVIELNLNQGGQDKK
jgi:hypothetical protein